MSVVGLLSLLPRLVPAAPPAPARSCAGLARRWQAGLAPPAPARPGGRVLSEWPGLAAPQRETSAIVQLHRVAAR
ncbi:MAG: hypothetical protein NZM27_08160 [Acetobacteraceae bacterium]|nr:hypothetical protein [Acetobacteraceae bacterium]MCX7685984.1 hypothetical protein [Acetobacteraceae bacterium]MDW8397519.1 hypothetical protein [Acetobacteraceae bacterium]